MISDKEQVMTLMFMMIGLAADYGHFRRWLLLVVTVICWALQFASMSLTSALLSALLPLSWLTEHVGPDRWGVTMVLYMIGYISYGTTLVFFTAALPRLARNTAHLRELKAKYNAGEIEMEVYEVEESMEKNQISNISTVSIVVDEDGWCD